jgi:DNA-binding transcriptional regulator/RsmH inhibitor MraZ
MLRFAGNHVLTLDDKDRVVLPLGLRKCLDEKERDEFLSKGFMMRPSDKNEFLELYPREVYDEYIHALEAKYPPWDDDGQSYLRYFTSKVEPIDLDRQYRFPISPDYQSVVGIPSKEPGVSREVVFVGRTKKIEIWPMEGWKGWEAGNARRNVPKPPAE